MAVGLDVLGGPNPMRTLRPLAVFAAVAAILLSPSSAQSGNPSPQTTVGIPTAPLRPLPSLGNMPSPSELELRWYLGAFSESEFRSELAQAGMDRQWWEGALDVQILEVPRHFAEYAEWQMFIELENLLTGVQSGCWFRPADGASHCIDFNPGASYGYQVVSDMSDFLDTLFPLAWSMIPPTQGGTTGDGRSWERWECRELRRNSRQADDAAWVGRLGGGTTAVAGGVGLAASGALAGALGVFGGGLTPAGLIAGAGAILGLGVGAVVVVVAAAVIAGVAARKAYVSGNLPVLNNCPNCGVETPPDWECRVDEAMDLCTCVEPSEDGGGSSGLTTSDATRDDSSTEGEGSPLLDAFIDSGYCGTSGNGSHGGGSWTTPQNSCTKWTSYEADSEECGNCGFTEEQMQTTMGDDDDEVAVEAYCQVCEDATDVSYIGLLICVSGAAEGT